MLLRRLGTIVLSVSVWLCAAPASAGQTIRIGIGHQSFCTDTYAGGLVVKGLQLLEKYLPKDGKYKDVTYDIVWEDYTSGPPITNQMLAGKLDIGVMGDYPPPGQWRPFPGNEQPPQSAGVHDWLQHQRLQQLDGRAHGLRGLPFRGSQG